MKLSDFIQTSKVNYKKSKNSFLSQITTCDDVDTVDFHKYDAILVGNLEGRGGESEKYEFAADHIRKQFSQLSNTSKDLKILDVGNFILGSKIKDSFVCLHEAMGMLQSYNIPIIVIGGTLDATIPLSKNILEKSEYPTITTIDSRIDFKNTNKINNRNYLQDLRDLHSCLRLIHVAHQTFFTKHTAFDWFNQNYFPLCRLGKIDTPLAIEPLIRDAQIVCFDIDAIKFSDSPANVNASSTGLTAYDACQLAWFAGLSDKMNMFFIGEYMPELDVRNVSGLLIAQILWHVFDGVSQRKNDSDFNDENLYVTYYVKNEYVNQDLIFYQSKRSQNMWVEIPVDKLSEKRILPCSTYDYQLAMNNEVPESWMIEFNRLFKKN